VLQIILALFMLTIAIYAWKAWRRNPLCSLKSTVKAWTVFLLGLALAIGLVLLVMNHLPSQSPLVLTLCCMAFIVAITLGLCAASLRITDGPPGKAPPGTKPADSYRRKLYPWLLGTGIVLLLLLAWAALVVPLSPEFPLALAALVLGIGGAALGSLYIKARRTDYAIAALMTNFWVHWQYASGQSDAWLGPNGLLYGGEYTPWLASGNYLMNARAELVPPLFLVLTFEKYYGRESAPVTIRVLIPEGRESDMELLERKLRTQYPKAHIHFHKEEENEKN